MIGPTGVGKTEIARRVAKLTDAPFIRVEVPRHGPAVGRGVVGLLGKKWRSSVSSDSRSNRNGQRPVAVAV